MGIRRYHLDGHVNSDKIIPWVMSVSFSNKRRAKFVNKRDGNKFYQLEGRSNNPTFHDLFMILLKFSRLYSHSLHNYGLYFVRISHHFHDINIFFGQGYIM
jgi:hypothetical protein